MPEQEWVEADAFIVDALVGDDRQLTDVLAANAAAELPTIDVSPAQGKLLSLLARTIGARRVLEIGTLGGYSTLWFARAVGESGTVVTLEYEPKHAAIARANLDRAGVGDRCEIRVGAALDHCRAWVDDIVVDVAASLERDEEIVSDLDGPRRNAATHAALAAADEEVR